MDEQVGPLSLEYLENGLETGLNQFFCVIGGEILANE